MDRKWRIARRLRTEMTEAERKLWSVLRGRSLGGHKFRRQYPLGGYVADFVCIEARLVIEVDGGQHADAMDKDVARTSRIEAMGYRVARFWNHEVMQDIDGVFRKIEMEIANLCPTPPQPSPTSQGRE